MKTSPCHGATSNTSWQTERANRLHRQFLRVQAAQQNGKSIRKALKQFEWYWRGRSYHSNPRKQVRFSLPTLHRLFYVWKRGGRTPAAVQLKYNPVRRHVSKSFLLAFVAFCSEPRQTLSLLSTWNTFVASLSGKPPITYGSALRYFNSRQYRAIQQEYRKIGMATAAIRRLRTGAEQAVEAHWKRKGKT